MISIVVTGGVATGKTAFGREFVSAKERTQTFDCDRVVHELLTTESIRERVTLEFGDSVLDRESGLLDRGRLRNVVFNDGAARATLEGILHPEVRSLCKSSLSEAKLGGSVDVFLMDVPLFYESGFPIDHDLEVVVATTPAEQRKRLLGRSPIGEEVADRIIQSQMPIGEKVELADVVIWNGGDRPALEAQTNLFIKWLKKKMN